MLSIKYVSLLVLAVQNSALILVMRYSRTIAGPKYIPSTAVLISECIKTTLSMTILLYTSWRARSKTTNMAVDQLSNGQTQSLLRECWHSLIQMSALIPVMVPAILYTIQNNLQYLAASNLDAATFQVLYQGKVLTTALFAVLILRQRLDWIKWLAIFILTAGIVLISYPSSPSKVASRDTLVDNRVIGLLAVLSACIISGFTGVYLEMILKKAKKHSPSGGVSNLWVRNVQLSAASIVVAVVGAAAVNGRQILDSGFFYGYNPIVWVTILLQATGGLIVALVITYADNIMKGFATSLSLIASTAISAATGDVVLTTLFIGGVVLVLGATNLYGWACTKEKKENKEEEGEVASSLLSEDVEKQEDHVNASVDNTKTDTILLSDYPTNLPAK